MRLNKTFHKYILFYLLIFSTQYSYPQIVDEKTTQFLITGKVKQEKVINLTDLNNFPSHELKNTNTSCSPKKEENTKLVKAVLVKNILDSVRFDYNKPRQLGQFYFLFVASDGYKIVFSFNEIFNTEVGNQLYVVTELDGVKAEDLNASVLMLSTKDLKGGSRNVKGLSKIVVCLAE